MRKLFTIIFLALLCLNAMAYDFSAVCGTGQTLYYNITSNVEPYTVEVTSENTDDPYYTTYPTGDLVIPETVEYNSIIYSVTSIGQFVFSNCSGLTSVTIPNSVTSIGSYAFMDCSGLTGTLTIPNSVTSIGNYAFSSCRGIETIVVESGNTTYDSRDDCNAIIETATNTLIAGCKNTIIPNSVTSIGDGAFAGSNLTSINIPNSVTSIGESAFHGCSGLTSINIPNSVTSIGDGAFMSTGLTEITIPNSVVSIGVSAFRECSITSVTIPNSVTSIGGNAFAGCSGLTTVNFNATNCTTMGELNSNVFDGLATLNIGENVRNIPAYAFRRCSGLTSVTIPNSVTSIGDYAFSACSDLTSVIIGNSVESIGNNPFSSSWGIETIVVESGNTTYDSRDDCNAIIETATNILIAGCKNTIIPNSVISIGENTFSECIELTSINIPNSVTSIGDRAFHSCYELTSVAIGNSVTSIGSYAFDGCSGLTEVTIPDSVTNIGNNAFGFCNGLTTVNFNAKNCTTMGSSDNPVFENCTLFSNLNIGENVKSIPDYAFYGCTGITSVTIPDAVESIGDEAFYIASDLTYISLGTGVMHIGSNAFNSTGWYDNQSEGILYLDNWCLGYKGNAPTGGITFADGTLGIASYTFWLCEELTSVTMPNSVKYIDNYAFYACNGLTNVTIPESVTNIGDMAYNSCSGLTSITIPESVESIGDMAFYGCNELNTVNFNATNCVSMNSSFADCEALSTLNIGENVTNIPEYAFIRTYITNINAYPYTPPTIDNSSFETDVFLSANVYTPCEAAESYRNDNGWRQFENIQGDTTVNFSITVQSQNETMGSVTGSGENFSCETETTITATPATGYRFVRWNDGNTDNPRTIIVISDSTFVATFRSDNEIVCDNPCPAVTDQPMSETAIPYYATEELVFNIGEDVDVCITIKCPETINVEFMGTPAEATITDMTITEFLNLPDGLSYCVSLVDMNPTTNNYATLHITGVPTAAGEYQLNLSCNVSGTASVLGIDQPISNQAITFDPGIDFIILEQGIKLIRVLSNNDAYGSVYGGGTYDEGSTATISATPYEGYRFVQWNDGNTENPRSITVTSDSTFVANFIREGNYPLIVDFEELSLEGENSSWIGDDETGKFTSSYLTLYNEYDNDFYTGFAYTNGTDTLTNTYTNLSSCVGHGAGNSANYVTAYIGSDWMGDYSPIPVGIKIDTEYSGDFTNRGAYFCMPVLLSKYVIGTDNHYASNQFYFKLQVRAYANDNLIGNREIMMADFTEGNSYMMDDWTYVDLSWLENADSLNFIAISNDTAGGYGINAPLFFCMDNFGADAQVFYTIIATAGENGTITPNGELSIGEGRSQTFTILANYGYRISSVMVDETENVTEQLVDGVYTFENVTENHTIAATFEAIPIASFTTNPEESGNTLNITPGDLVEYTSTSLNAHHIVWTFEGGDTVTSTQNYVPVRYSEEGTFLTTLVAYNEDETLTDTATLTVIVSTVNYFTISVTSNNDAYGMVSGGGTYEEGTQVVITATPYEGYRFVSWNDGNTENPRSITVTSDSTFVANFTANQLPESINLTDYNGNTYDIDALLDDGKYVVFAFFFTTDHYSQEEVPDVVNLYIQMGCNTADVMLIALEVEVHDSGHDIAWYITEYGATYPIAPLEDNPINRTLFDNWGLDGTPTYILIQPDRSMNEMNRPVSADQLTAVGAHESPCSDSDTTYTITVQSNNESYGSVSGGGTYEEGSTATISATPYEGYSFVSWNDGDESSPRTIVVTSDSTFVANFAKCEITHSIDTVVNNFVTVGDHTFYSTGNYSFAVLNETACDTIFDIRLRVLAEPVYDIGPNPAKSLLNINSDGFISAVEFYTVTGQFVMRKEVNGYEAEFDVEGLVDGVYILRIYGAESSLPSMYKIIKE